jgi:hypothetical protein
LLEEEKQEGRGFGLALGAGAVILALILGGVYLLSQRGSTETARALEPLPYGATEQAYAEHIHFVDLRMSRAANYLNQEFTFLYCTMSNAGNKTIRQMEVTVEFRDVLNQVVLRHTQRVLGPDAPQVNGGFRRDLEFTFEHIPSEWNYQNPTLRVTGLLLEE